MTRVQAWVRAGYVNAATRDDADFIKGRSALSYLGHWTYATYRQALGAVGPQDWLRDPHLVLPAIMALSIWQGAGFQMLVFLAGLQSIPGDLYEAARLEGASPLQQFRHITLPMLRNTTVFVLLTTTIQAFQLFTQVQIIANSGASAPLDSFRTMVMLLVFEGFRRGRIGYAAALSVVFFLIVLALSLLQRALLRDREDR